MAAVGDTSGAPSVRGVPSLSGLPPPAVEQYGKNFDSVFAGSDVPVFLARVVKKVSSSGKLLERVLAVTEDLVFLLSWSGSVSRIAQLQGVTRVCYGAAPGAPAETEFHLQLSDPSAPAIAWRPCNHEWNPPGENVWHGVNVIRQLWARHAGRTLPVQAVVDMNSMREASPPASPGYAHKVLHELSVNGGGSKLALPAEMLVRRDASLPSLGLDLLATDTNNVVIAGTQPRTPAARCGLGAYKGRVLTHVNGRPVHTIQDCLDASHGDEEVRLAFGAPVQNSAGLFEEAQSLMPDPAPSPTDALEDTRKYTEGDERGSSDEGLNMTFVDAEVRRPDDGEEPSPSPPAPPPPPPADTPDSVRAKAEREADGLRRRLSELELVLRASDAGASDLSDAVGLAVVTHPRGGARLRRSPGVDDFVGAVRNGDAIEVQRVDGDFRLILVPESGSKGWIRSQYITECSTRDEQDALARFPVGTEVQLRPTESAVLESWRRPPGLRGPPARCDGCDAQFGSVDELAQHKDAAGHGRWYSCPLPGDAEDGMCAYEFASEEALEHHKRTVHATPPQTPAAPPRPFDSQHSRASLGMGGRKRSSIRQTETAPSSACPPKTPSSPGSAGVAPTPPAPARPQPSPVAPPQSPVTDAAASPTAASAGIVESDGRDQAQILAALSTPKPVPTPPTPQHLTPVQTPTVAPVLRPSFPAPVPRPASVPRTYAASSSDGTMQGRTVSPVRPARVARALAGADSSRLRSILGRTSIRMTALEMTNTPHSRRSAAR